MWGRGGLLVPRIWQVMHVAYEGGGCERAVSRVRHAQALSQVRLNEVEGGRWQVGFRGFGESGKCASAQCVVRMRSGHC